MTQIFNTEFELSMRLLLLLSVLDKETDIDTLIIYDFFTTYGKNYNLTDENLNGNANTLYSEITSRRLLFNQVIKSSVKNAYVSIKYTKNGYLYCLSNYGREIVNEMKSDYAFFYKNNATVIYNFSKNKTLEELKEYAKMIERNNGDLLWED